MDRGGDLPPPPSPNGRRLSKSRHPRLSTSQCLLVVSDAIAPQERDKISDKDVQFSFFSKCTLPTSFGPIQFSVFKDEDSGIEAIACMSPLTFRNEQKEGVVVRIHDACITSEVFHSVKCDCKLQLERALEYMVEFGGVVIYLNQEGRGIGLANKIAAYHLQETQGLDTVDANRSLGLPDDSREYHAARDILAHFEIKSVLLMSNNNEKVQKLRALGVNVLGTVPLIVKPQSAQMEKYMKDKARRMGHMFETLRSDDNE